MNWLLRIFDKHDTHATEEEKMSDAEKAAETIGASQTTIEDAIETISTKKTSFEEKTRRTLDNLNRTYSAGEAFLDEVDKKLSALQETIGRFSAATPTEEKPK
jgi:3-hydroxyisobutyrate dehydrogenase-like beta-hydroxyacid dehydrogenase